MIKWDREQVARFLDVMWKYPELPRGEIVTTFAVKSSRAELRVLPHKSEIELTLFCARGGEERLVSWLMVCDRIDVHDDVDETPAVTFWAPNLGASVFSWLGIYREGKSFSIFSNTAPAFNLPQASRSLALGDAAVEAR